MGKLTERESSLWAFGATEHQITNNAWYANRKDCELEAALRVQRIHTLTEEARTKLYYEIVDQLEIYHPKECSPRPLCLPFLLAEMERKYLRWLQSEEASEYVRHGYVL
jgi:hypothetical protein